MNPYRLITTIILLLLPFAEAHADLYSWTDSAGNKYFVDDLTKVPPGYRSQAQNREAAEETQAGREERTISSNYYRTSKASDNRGKTEHRDKNGRGESYWRNKAENLRQQLQDEQVNYETLNKQQSECEGMQLYVRGLPKDCASKYRNQKIKSEQKIERIRKSLEIDLPEEARRADAYPGWIR